MRGVVVLILLLVITRQEANAVSTIASDSASPHSAVTEATSSGSPNSAVTDAPSSGSPNSAVTDAPSSGSPNSAVTDAPSSGSPNSAVTDAPSSGSPNSAVTDAPSSGSPNSAVTDAPSSASPDSAMTEAPDTGSPQTALTNDPNATTTRTEPVTTMTGGLTTSQPGTCSPVTCVTGSTCIQLYNTYECRCPLTYHYDAQNKTCSGGESFYGEFTIKGQDFNPNPATPEYTEIYVKVVNQCTNALSDLPSYLGTVVLEMRLVSSKSQTRSGDVSAKVSNMFTKDTIIAELVHEKLKTTSGPLTYTSRSICDGFYCDADTTICAATPDDQSATCTCQDGKFSSSAVPAVTSCRDCDPKCYQTDGAFCNLASKSGASCACIAGYKKSGDKCQKCDFGYSGENCADNFLLILVVVGAVLGAVVLALVGAVIGVTVSSKKGKKSNDRAVLIEKDEAPLSGGSAAPARLFPKVQAKTNLGEVNRGANMFDDYEEYSRNIPRRDYEEDPWYEMAKKDRNY